MAPWAKIGDLQKLGGGTEKGVISIIGAAAAPDSNYVACDDSVVEGASYNAATETFGDLVWDVSKETASVPEDGEKYATEFKG
tara:strand:+ start:9343 stop:9591 length:249 start_codon:yes stop_codon:yes gene_type:complete